jgi:signal transduction histidine kinase
MAKKVQKSSKQMDENKKLKDLNNWQRAVLNASPYSIITTDIKGIITSINLAAEKMIGYKAIELVGKFTPELIHDKTETIEKAKELCLQLGIIIEPNFAAYVRLSEKIGPTLMEWTYICKNGNRIPVRLCVTPIRDDDDKVTGYVGIAEDISETKKLVQTIDLQKAQMLSSAKFSALGEMANGVSHEINNPLSIISCISNSLQKKIKEGKINYEIAFNELNKISNNAKRIANIVTSLKEFSRDSGIETYNLIELNEIISEVLNFSSEKIKYHEIKLILNHDPHIKLYCQKSQIIKVFLACIFNSVHAIDQLKERWIKIESDRKENTLLISITDSGLGISNMIQDKLMQPFFTTKEFGNSLGLGLSISKGIIEAHQGSFYLDKNHPHTRFVITLPLKTEEKKKAA